MEQTHNDLMRDFLKLLICATSIISSCSTDRKQQEVIFDYYYGDSHEVRGDSISISYKSVNDSIYEVRYKQRQPVYVYESDKGVFQSTDNLNYNIGFSFQDTLAHIDLSFPFDSMTTATLNTSKVFSIEGSDVPVYWFNETFGDEFHSKSHSGSITYYAPKIGVLIYYTGEEPHGAYIRRFPKNDIRGKLIGKIRADTVFYVGHLMKNPTIKGIKELPSDNVK